MMVLPHIKNLGVDFDAFYYESNTYLLGKMWQIGLDKGFEKDPDGSVWIDLTDEGLDRKIVLSMVLVYDGDGHSC
jgi:arginyl-tRNA synthetase